MGNVFKDNVYVILYIMEKIVPIFYVLMLAIIMDIVFMIMEQRNVSVKKDIKEMIAMKLIVSIIAITMVFVLILRFVIA